MSATSPGAVEPGSRSGVPLTALGRIRARGRIRGRLALLGPAFVAAVAYIDPGNFATNFSSGALFGYRLTWVIVMANVMAILVQYLSAKVGIASGHSLPELCADGFSKPVNVGLGSRPRWSPSPPTWPSSSVRRSA